MMKLKYSICCGLDVHKNVIVATIVTTNKDGISEYLQKSFSTINSDIQRFHNWLIENNCYHVCMESTGKYWIPIFNYLENDIDVCLTHPKYVKAIKGKKTDKKDSKWIADLYKFDHIVYKSIDYDIFDFIRKKKLKEDIHNKMNRLLKKLESDHDRIIVESGNRIVAIYYDDIQYIHTDKNYIVIHGREEYKIRSTFKDFIKKIKKNDFITISYGILVNMRYVQYINLKEMMVVLENEIQLPLSYKYKTKVKNAYQEYKIQ